MPSQVIRLSASRNAPQTFVISATPSNSRKGVRTEWNKTQTLAKKLGLSQKQARTLYNAGGLSGLDNGDVECEPRLSRRGNLTMSCQPKHSALYRQLSRLHEDDILDATDDYDSMFRTSGTSALRRAARLDDYDEDEDDDAELVASTYAYNPKPETKRPLKVLEKPCSDNPRGRTYETNAGKCIEPDTYRVFNRLHAKNKFMRDPIAKEARYALWLKAFNSKYKTEEERQDKLTDIIKSRGLNPSERGEASSTSTSSSRTKCADGQGDWNDGRGCREPTSDDWINMQPWSSLNGVSRMTQQQVIDRKAAAERKFATFDKPMDRFPSSRRYGAPAATSAYDLDF